jgi:hypothetical protein
MVDRTLKFRLDIISTDVQMFLVQTMVWKIPVTFMGSHFALLNLPGFCRSPCLVLDVSSTGDAIVAAIPDRMEGTYAACRKHPKKLSFLEDPKYQFELEDMRKVLNYEFKGVMILKISLNFLFVYEPIDEACLKKFAKLFHFKRGEESFSFKEDFIKKHLNLIGSIDTPLNIEDGVPAKKHSHSTTKTDENVGSPPQGVHLTKEMSPQAKKMLASRSELRLQHLPPPEDVGKHDPSLHSPQGPIWNPKQVHCNRYDDPDWKKVAAILINAQNDKTKHWKDYAKLIGGGHSRSTLVFWFKKLEKDDSWAPKRDSHGNLNISIAPELAEKIWNRIESEFLSHQFLFTDAECHTLAMEEYRNAPEEMKLKEKFEASRNWINRFRRQHSITIRSPHLHRRTKPNPQAVLEFISRLEEAFQSMDKRCIINADETSWPVVFANRKTWHKATAEKTEHSDVVVKVDANVKSAFTVMASITANGETLPLYMLAKGKTAVCEKQLEAINENVIFHSQSGWMTIDVMEKYFEFLRQTMTDTFKIAPRQKLLLVLDVYAAHRNAELVKLAGQHNIELLFIPAGMTGELQPLDATIFGMLKSAGAGRWTSDYLYDPYQRFETKKASFNLQKCWEKVSHDAIIHSWETVFRNAKKYLENPEEINGFDQPIEEEEETSEFSE